MMNNIKRINGYGELQSLSSTRPAGGNYKTPPAANMPNSSGTIKADKVEISEKAMYMSYIAALPEVRQEKVDAIRQQLAQGTYDINGKLSTALDRFMDEYVG